MEIPQYNDMSGAELDITPFLAFPVKLHIMHLLTKRYSHHTELGKAYEEMDGQCDEFIEKFKGENPEIHLVYDDIQLDEVDVDNPYEYFMASFEQFISIAEQYAVSESLKDIVVQMGKIASSLGYFLQME